MKKITTRPNVIENCFSPAVMRSWFIPNSSKAQKSLNRNSLFIKPQVIQFANEKCEEPAFAERTGHKWGAQKCSKQRIGSAGGKKINKKKKKRHFSLCALWKCHIFGGGVKETGSPY